MTWQFWTAFGERFLSPRMVDFAYDLSQVSSWVSVQMSSPWSSPNKMFGDTSLAPPLFPPFLSVSLLIGAFQSMLSVICHSADFPGARVAALVDEKESLPASLYQLLQAQTHQSTSCSRYVLCACTT